MSMPFTMTSGATVAEIAAADPAAIRIFQRHQIDFCCGGKLALAEVCARRGLDPEALLAELYAAPHEDAASADWRDATLTALIAHIQQRYHVPLRVELPRLSEMLAKVVRRHGDRFPSTLLPLSITFEHLHRDLIEHMGKEDAVLFPAIIALETTSGAGSADSTRPDQPIDQPIQVMETEHDAAGVALATLRQLTHGYSPPEDACATFRGLYHGLAELERDMHMHVYLENHILFPRAGRLARDRADASDNGGNATARA
jgi:regulator of cell morphogenesis and NO signaling